jgi:hypothetical protein
MNLLREAKRNENMRLYGSALFDMAVMHISC